jgi:DNA modification methylase
MEAETQNPKSPCLVFLENNIQLYCGEVLDTLDLIPEGSVDLIVADPPYNLSSGVPRARRVNVLA